MRRVAVLLLGCALSTTYAGLRGAKDTLSALGVDESPPKTEEERIQRLEKLIKEIDKDRDGKITNQELKVLNDSPFYLIAYSLDLFQGSHEQGREKAPCAAR
jgi:hypothetical protein